MRHAHFAIGEAERDAWLRHMRTALDELALDEAHDAQLWDYLVMAAHSLVNQDTRRAPIWGWPRPDQRKARGTGPRALRNAREGQRRQSRVSLR